MHVVDSSALIEFFTDGPNKPHFRDAILDTDAMLVPSVVLYEVYKIMTRVAGDEAADASVMALRSANIVDLDERHALAAARISTLHGLALADAIIYATAQLRGAILWTQDEHFKDLPEVRFFPKSA